MRSAPITPPGFDRLPFECRLRFHRPLKGVEVVPADATPTAMRPAPPVARPEPPSAPPKPAPAPAPTSTPAAVPATDASQVEIARQLKADRERIEAVLAEIQSDVASLRKERAARVGELQRVAIELALTIASRLLHERVVSGDFPIDAKVSDMISQLGEDAVVSVHLNPADLELLKDRLGDEPLSPDRDNPRFVPDATLARGACQVEGRESMLLSDVSRDLQEIREDLLRSLDNARP
jgi:flagellar biosynthesis/type III secretory pathway protein FliH